MKERFELLLKPGFLALLVLLMVLAGLSVVIYGERDYRADRSRELGSQAQILAATASAALAFHDREAATEYAAALSAAPDVLAAAIYDERGTLFASFARNGIAVPPQLSRSVRDVDPNRILASAPISLGGERRGTAVVEANLTPTARRISRYAIFTLMLALIVLPMAVLLVSRRALRLANLALADRAAELADANGELRAQIVEREKAEDALRQAQKMEAIGQLTGGVAHDFNNLLQIVMLSLSGLALRPVVRDSADCQARIKMGLDAVERGATLTRQLLAFSRRQPLAPRVFAVNPLVSAMSELFSRTLGEGVEVRWEPGTEVGSVRADPHQLENALLNLAVNARDAMPDGGSIVVSTSRADAALIDRAGLPAGDFIWIRVADSGTGMSEAVRQRAIEPFFSTKSVGKGSGLGLSQVYGYARQSGGELIIDSAEGEGTAITLLLPRELTAGEVAAAPAGSVAASGPTPVSTEVNRILVVEDNDAVRDTTAMGLRELGYEVETAPDADVALEILRGAKPFDVLFTDVVMPGTLDGMALAVEARRLRPDLKILLTSGYPRTTLLRRVELDGHTPLLPKPYDIQTLCAQLRRL